MIFIVSVAKYNTKKNRGQHDTIVKPYNPTTSTKSPSSRSAAPISDAGSNLSPSSIRRGPSAGLPFFPFLLSTVGSGYCSAKPDFFRNALTMAPHAVEGRTVRTISFVLPERRVSRNVSDADSAPVSSDSSGMGDGARALERKWSPRSTGCTDRERWRRLSCRYSNVENVVPSSASDQIFKLCGVADGKTRLFS